MFVFQVIGVKSVKLTNSRGFCAELSTAIVVIVASRYGAPFDLLLEYWITVSHLVLP